MISERQLKKWRRDALYLRRNVKSILRIDVSNTSEYKPILELIERFLCMTQELIDQHLLKL